MKSITVHKLDDELVSVLEAKAEAENTSLNRVIKQTLREAFNLEGQQKEQKRAELSLLAGTWSSDESESV